MLKKLSTFFFLFVFISCCVKGESNLHAASELKARTIGVLARRGMDECTREWVPTAQYLSERIPGYQFDIIPFNHKTILSAVKENQVDFIVVNPSAYVEMQTLFGISRLATIKRITPSGSCALYGGIIFCKANRYDINVLKDLSGKSFTAVDESSFGGWQMAWREFKEAGINPYKDFKRLVFYGTQDAVVYAVRDGKVDAGTVATPILEQMTDEGKISPDSFKIINPQQSPDFPYTCSTRIYPEWAFAKLRNTPESLAEKVVVSLLDMPVDSPAASAAGCSGWTVPFDYGSVEACLKDLKVGIFRDYGKISFSQLFTSYRWQIIFGAVFTCCLIWLLIYTLQLNWKLESSRQRLQEEIIERKQNEETVLESAARLKALFNATSDSVILMDPEGKILDLNQTAAVRRQKERDQLIGKNIYDFLPPEAAGPRRRAVERIINERREISNEERRLFHYDWVSEGRHFSTRVFPVMDENGKVFQLASFSRDISERKAAEAALKESEEKYRSMLDAMDDALYICSSDFQIQYQNPAMTRRIGQDAVGELCHRIIHGMDHQCPWCVHDRVMNGDYLKTEVISPMDQKTYNISHSPILHSDGTVSKLSIFRDITELKTMEERMDQAQRMEAIGALAGGIAHDFNNILFPVIGMSEMLMGDFPEGSREREHAAMIFQAARRAGELVKQILSFSRQTTHEKIPVRVSYILKEVLKLTRATIPADIEITKSIQTTCGLVMADPTQLHQIAMNLMTNAFHAVEQKGGHIDIGLKESELTGPEWPGCSLEPGKYAVISVSDTGYGIPPELMGKIFEPYFTTKEIGKGTGLGLSVVHGIVKDHNGDIRVSSELGKGSIFSVYLPIIESETRQPPEKKIHRLETGTERILIVDDEAIVIQYEQKILEKLGYRVTARTSSIDALAEFKTRPHEFDLVITDMTMPNLTGDKLALKLLNVRPDIPIIICTGFSTRMDHQKAEALGIKGLLMKPVVTSELTQLVRKVLEETGKSADKKYPTEIKR